MFAQTKIVIVAALLSAVSIPVMATEYICKDGSSIYNGTDSNGEFILVDGTTYYHTGTSNTDASIFQNGYGHIDVKYVDENNTLFTFISAATPNSPSISCKEAK